MKYLRSLRFRIMLVLLLIGIVPIVIASSVIVRGYKSRAIALRISHVKNQCEVICSSILSEDYLAEGGKSAVIDSQLSMISNIYNGRLLIINGAFKVIRDTYDIDTGRTSLSKEVITCFQTGSGSTQYDDRNAYIEVTSPIINPSTFNVEGVLIASVSTNEIQQNARHLENQGIVVTVVSSILVLICGFFISNILVRPFAEVARDAQFQTLGLADVDHFILFVPHDIHAGKFRQIRCLFIQFFPVHSDLFF